MWKWRIFLLRKRKNQKIIVQMWSEYYRMVSKYFRRIITVVAGAIVKQYIGNIVLEVGVNAGKPRKSHTDRREESNEKNSEDAKIKSNKSKSKKIWGQSKVKLSFRNIEKINWNSYSITRYNIMIINEIIRFYTIDVININI